MYDTAAPPLPNGQPRAWTTWAAHTDNVAYDSEIGHFEPRDRGDFDDTECTNGPLVPGCLSFSSGGGRLRWLCVPPRLARRVRSVPDAELRDLTTQHRVHRHFNQPYPIVRFETDLPRIEEANNGGGLDCDHHTGANCTVPPEGANFYPWYHLASVPSVGGANCAWALSNNLPNQISNFGGMRQGWGPLELTDYGFDQRYHNFARTLTGGNPCA